MSALARTTDPVTSHEAPAGVDLIRSQMLVLTFAKRYMGEFFTLKAITATYGVVHENGAVPYLSESRIRTAVKELREAHLIEKAGFTSPPQGIRREAIWTVVN